MKLLSCNSVLLAALYCCMSVTAFTTQPMSLSTSNNVVQPRCNALVLQSQGSDSDSATTGGMQSRARFLSTFAAAVVTTAVGVSSSALPASAAETKIDPAVKGTKKDPGYESCVSQCMYECTKPKGNEQMSRSQCLPGCKKQCATTKAQLMVGTPLPDTSPAK
jgi:hypothetical protein